MDFARALRPLFSPNAGAAFVRHKPRSPAPPALSNVRRLHELARKLLHANDPVIPGMAPVLSLTQQELLRIEESPQDVLKGLSAVLSPFHQMEIRFRFAGGGRPA